MKNRYKLPFILLLFISTIFSAQQGKDWKKLNKEEKKATLKGMTSEQKMNLLNSFKQNLIEEQLDIPEKSKEEFSVLYEDYQTSQRNIKNSFQRRKDLQNMTDEEAVNELDKSFEVGQRLLDNKKDYAKKFQRVMKPQQILQMFENEGRIRSKVRARNQELQNRNQEPRYQSQDPGNQNRSSDNSRGNSAPRRR